MGGGHMTEVAVVARLTGRHASAHPPLARRTPCRADDWFDAETLSDARRYAKPLHRIKLVGTIIGDGAVLIFLLVKGGPWAARLLGGPWPIRLVAGIFALMVVTTLAGCWTTAYVELSYDKRWGLSNQTTGRFIGDQLKEVVVSTLLLTLLLTPVYAAIHATRLWWLFGWMGFMAVQLLAAFLYPVVIMPRFNKFTPLPDGELRQRIEAVAALAGTSIQGVYTMDASRRSSRGNAFVAGFGATKRVVLFDTILEHPVDTIEQIVAHEIGHYRRHHILLSFPVQALVFLAAFILIDVVASWSWALRQTGVTHLGDPGSLPLFLLAFGVVLAGLRVASAWMTRFLEREADLEALELLGDPDAFIDVWRRLAPKDKAELEPSAWTKLNHSHPGVAERMAFGKLWADQNARPLHLP